MLQDNLRLTYLSRAASVSAFSFQILQLPESDASSDPVSPRASVHFFSSIFAYTSRRCPSLSFSFYIANIYNLSSSSSSWGTSSSNLVPYP